MIPGIDVSEAQGSIDWQRVAGAGVRFAFVKARERRDDRRFRLNYDEARRVGIPVGAYCYARPTEFAPEAQAAAFVATVASVTPLEGPGELPLMLDLEETAPALADWAVRFLDACDRATGRESVLYTTEGFLNGAPLAGDRRLASRPLFIAEVGFGGAEATRPPRTPWPWAVWQHSWQGAVPGIGGRVDLDWYNGTDAQLAAWANEAPAPPGPNPQPTAEDDPMILVPDNAQPWTSGPWKGRRVYFELDVPAGELRGYNGGAVKLATIDQFGISHMPAPKVPPIKGVAQNADRDGLVIAAGADGGTFDYAYPDGASWAGHP